MEKAKDADDQIRALLEILKQKQLEHMQIGADMMSAKGKKVFVEDLFFWGMMQKSICIIKGFCNEIEDDNFLCAAPLVRIHLDTLLNTFAVIIAKDPKSFVFQKMEGKQTHDIKDKDGNKMKDRYLARELSNSKEINAPWALNLYSGSSAFIHTSDKHILSVISKISEPRNVQIQLGESIDIPKSSIIESLNAMIEITNCLFFIWKSWIYNKNETE